MTDPTDDLMWRREFFVSNPSIYRRPRKKRPTRGPENRPRTRSSRWDMPAEPPRPHQQRPEFPLPENRCKPVGEGSTQAPKPDAGSPSSDLAALAREALRSIEESERAVPPVVGVDEPDFEAEVQPPFRRSRPTETPAHPKESFWQRLRAFLSRRSRSSQRNPEATTEGAAGAAPVTVCNIFSAATSDGTERTNVATTCLRCGHTRWRGEKGVCACRANKPR